MSGGIFSPKANAFLAGHAERLAETQATEVVGRVEALVAAHDRWRGGESLNLNPAEGLLSRRARALLNSDLATRLTEGAPGDKAYPHGPLNEQIDEIEATVIALAQRLFGARYVEWRPVSNSMANAVVFAALLKPGDLILAQDEDGGGNYSYHPSGPAGVFGARVVPMARTDPNFEIDLAGVARQVAEHRPRMLVFGGSKVLFPYPIRELRAIADSVGALLVCDAAHLGLHISRGDFQRPLAEGAHIVTLSTHKVMGGPVGGLVLSDDLSIAQAVAKTMFPGLLQTRDLNKYAALAVSLSEVLAFGDQLARAMRENAQALASALSARGFDLLASERGFSRTHQLFLRFSDANRAAEFERRCHAANIFLADCALAGDLAKGARTGARAATHEVTRLGMGVAEMDEIAGLIYDADQGASVELLRGRVAALAQRFSRINFSFDP